MTTEVYNPQAIFSLTITEAAAKFFENKLAKQDATAIRLSVKKSGCTGYAYTIDPVNEAEEGDLEITLEGICFYVSEKAKPIINGSEIDLLKKGLDKIIDIHNPNITASCGCGSSFSVD